MQHRVARMFVLHGDAVLLVRRSITDDVRPGEWDVPGGGVDVDRGESTRAGAARELFKETGIVADPALLVAITHDVPAYSVSGKLRTAYVCVLDARRARPMVTLNHEHDAFRWEPLGTLFDVYSHPVYSAAFKEYMQENLHA